jgi:hypothetical protein
VCCCYFNTVTVSTVTGLHCVGLKHVHCKQASYVNQIKHGHIMLICFYLAPQLVHNHAHASNQESKVHLGPMIGKG